MTKFSDNDSPSLLFTEQGSAPSSPAASHQRLYIRTSDHHLVRVNSSGTVTDVEAGAGGLTHSYVGYNTVGGSTETVTEKRFYATKFTASASGMLLSIGIRLKWQADAAFYVHVALMDDNSSTIGKVLAVGAHPPQTSNVAGIDLHQSSEVDRWVDFPTASYLTNGTVYWIGFQIMKDTSASPTYPLVYYDTSGSDRVYTGSNFLIVDGQNATQSDSTKKYSIRGDFIA